MTGHAADHVERLAEILAGSAPEAELAASELAGCADCRRELRECLELESELFDLAADARHEIDAARAVELGDEPGPAEVAFGARIRAEARPSRARAFALVGAVTAAAVLLFLFAPEPRSPTPLTPGPEAPVKLGDRLVPTHPVGAVETYTPFEWEAELPAAGWFRVEVVGTTAGWKGAPVRSSRLREARWEPTAEELARMPESIRWRVELHLDSSARDVLDAASARARIERP